MMPFPECDCVCGHPAKDHGNDPIMPGSSACDHAGGCHCLRYEPESERHEDLDPTLRCGDPLLPVLVDEDQLRFHLFMRDLLA